MKGIMNSKFVLPLLCGFMLLCGSASNGHCENSTVTTKRLLIVHSYEKGHICGQPQHDGAIAVLANAGWKVGKNLKTTNYFMDTKRKNNTPALIAEQAQRALAEIKSFRPDIVLTLDDNAFRTVGLALVDQPIQIVFSGMNGQPEDYNKIKKFMTSRQLPGHNITGVYEKLHIRQAIRVLSTMHDLKGVRILSDFSPTGQAIAKQVELELRPGQDEDPITCRIDHRTLTSWEAYQQEISTINADPKIGAFYLGTLLLKDAAGQTYIAPEIINYAIGHARKPAIGLNYAFIKMGLYGGASVDFFAMGYQSGQMIAAILNGADAGQLPIEDANRVALVFNLSRAAALGIDIPNDILMAADEVFSK